MYERLISLTLFFFATQILSFTNLNVDFEFYCSSSTTYSIQKSHSIFAGKNSPESWLFDLGIQGVWGEGGIPKKF